jgi:ribosomal protein S18 acetylase RimI-like enzyme
MISSLKPEHRPAIKALMEGLDVFTKAEVKCALELVDLSFSYPAQEEYVFDVEVEDGKVLGFICYGQSELSDRAYDLYWIAVAKEHQSKKVGTKLLNHMEDVAKGKKARIIVAETSSQDSYGSTRHFYTKRGYLLEASIKDFYKHGDDKVFFVKRFAYPTAAKEGP